MMTYNRHRHIGWTITIVISLFVAFGLLVDRSVTVFMENRPVSAIHTIIIDAGHGGVDGGATSCSGILESHLNLDIALRLEDLMHLLGLRTKMIRTEDISVYTEGNTIAAKKVSDLKQRVRIVNSTHNPVLISIHQNYFSDPQYSGAQVFYGREQGSDTLANAIQANMVALLNPESHRQSKKAENIYLIKQVNCPAILIECGFLSNPMEEKQLNDEVYQKKLCCVVAGVCSQYLNASDAA